jgi:hypothetical protein
MDISDHGHFGPDTSDQILGHFGPYFGTFRTRFLDISDHVLDNSDHELDHGFTLQGSDTQAAVSVFGHPTPICPWTPTTTLKKNSTL